jgi:hypothetical protein
MMVRYEFFKMRWIKVVRWSKYYTLLLWESNKKNDAKRSQIIPKNSLCYEDYIITCSKIILIYYYETHFLWPFRIVIFITIGRDFNTILIFLFLSGDRSEEDMRFPHISLLKATGISFLAWPVRCISRCIEEGSIGRSESNHMKNFVAQFEIFDTFSECASTFNIRIDKFKFWTICMLNCFVQQSLVFVRVRKGITADIPHWSRFEMCYWFFWCQ